MSANAAAAATVTAAAAVTAVTAVANAARALPSWLDTAIQARAYMRLVREAEESGRVDERARLLDVAEAEHAAERAAWQAAADAAAVTAQTLASARARAEPPTNLLASWRCFEMRRIHGTLATTTAADGLDDLWSTMPMDRRWRPSADGFADADMDTSGSPGTGGGGIYDAWALWREVQVQAQARAAAASAAAQMHVNSAF